MVRDVNKLRHHKFLQWFSTTPSSSLNSHSATMQRYIKRANLQALFRYSAVTATTTILRFWVRFFVCLFVCLFVHRLVQYMMYPKYFFSILVLLLIFRHFQRPPRQLFMSQTILRPNYTVNVVSNISQCPLSI